MAQGIHEAEDRRLPGHEHLLSRSRGEQFAAIPGDRDRVFNEFPTAWTLDQSKNGKALLLPLAALGLALESPWTLWKQTPAGN